MGKSLENYGQYDDTNRISAWGHPFHLGLGYMPFGDIIDNEAGSSTGQPILVYDRRINEIEKEVKALKEMIIQINRCFDPEESVVIHLRDIPRDQAREEIKRYFEAHHRENLYSHDITKALSIDLEMVDDVLEEMEREGKIKEVSGNG
jgi:predicted Rossmann fold nucleotide-binding protein DprA/Smf involved in DNA uptake